MLEQLWTFPHILTDVGGHLRAQDVITNLLKRRTPRPKQPRNLSLGVYVQRRRLQLEPRALPRLHRKLQGDQN